MAISDKESLKALNGSTEGLYQRTDEFINYWLTVDEYARRGGLINKRFAQMKLTPEQRQRIIKKLTYYCTFDSRILSGDAGQGLGMLGAKQELLKLFQSPVDQIKHNAWEGIKFIVENGEFPEAVELLLSIAGDNSSSFQSFAIHMLEKMPYALPQIIKSAKTNQNPEFAKRIFEEKMKKPLGIEGLREMEKAIKELKGRISEDKFRVLERLYIKQLKRALSQLEGRTKFKLGRVFKKGKIPRPKRRPGDKKEPKTFRITRALG